MVLVDAIAKIGNDIACIDMIEHIITVTMPIVGGPPRGNDYEDYDSPTEEEIANYPNITDEELEGERLVSWVAGQIRVLVVFNNH